MHLAPLASTMGWSPNLMWNFMQLEEDTANQLWWGPLPPSSPLTTKPLPSARAITPPRYFQSPTGVAALLQCNLTTLRYWKSNMSVTGSPPATPQTARTGTALPGRPKQTLTPTKSAPCTVLALTRISPSTSPSSSTTTADYASAKKCTTLQTSEHLAVIKDACFGLWESKYFKESNL